MVSHDLPARGDTQLKVKGFKWRRTVHSLPQLLLVGWVTAPLQFLNYLKPKTKLHIIWSEVLKDNTKSRLFHPNWVFSFVGGRGAIQSELILRCENRYPNSSLQGLFTVSKYRNPPSFIAGRYTWNYVREWSWKQISLIKQSKQSYWLRELMRIGWKK